MCSHTAGKLQGASTRAQQRAHGCNGRQQQLSNEQHMHMHTVAHLLHMMAGRFQPVAMVLCFTAHHLRDTLCSGCSISSDATAAAEHSTSMQASTLHAHALQPTHAACNLKLALLSSRISILRHASNAMLRQLHAHTSPPNTRSISKQLHHPLRCTPHNNRSLTIPHSTTAPAA